MAFSAKVDLTVPIQDSTANLTIKDTVGNKTDAAVIVAGNTASVLAYQKGLITLVSKILSERYHVNVYGPTSIDVDATGHFEAVIMDNDSGLIPVANITAGNYTIVRNRAGTDTTIVAATGFSKANGKVYVDYKFADADWDTDDTFRVVPAGDTTIDIGGSTYYVGIPTMSGYVTDMSTLEDKVDAIQVDLGDWSARTNLQSLLTSLGIPDVAGKDLYTCLITDRLDSATFGLSALNTDLDSILGDIGDASASTLLSLYGILGNPTTAISTVLGSNITLAVGAGSAAADQDVQHMVRYNVDALIANRTALETASLVAGAGSLADNAREGLLLRYVADTADTVMDNIGTISNSGALADTLAATLGDFVATPLVDRLTTINEAITDANTDIGNPSARTNLQSLEAMLGNPDTAGCSIYGNLGSFAAQSNLTSLLAVLGVPDVAGKSLYTCLITDRLDSATFGLSALNTDIDAILADLGDASASTLGSVYAILGNPGTQSINTQLGYAAAGSVAADATTIKGYLDATESVSSYAYTDAGGEQVVLTLQPAATQWLVHGIWLDTNVMTQDGTVKMYYMVDGSNYRLIDSEAVLATDEAHWLPMNMGICSDFKITYTEGADEGAERVIPYTVIYEVR